jgi:hypothetical protein
MDSHIDNKINAVEINGGKHLFPRRYRWPGAFQNQVSHTKQIFIQKQRRCRSQGCYQFMEMQYDSNTCLYRDKYAIAKQFPIKLFLLWVWATTTHRKFKINDFKNDICGIKKYLVRSTGNMLVDNHNTLNQFFWWKVVLIATHCEWTHY